MPTLHNHTAGTSALAPPAPFTHVSINSGNWSETTTWHNGQIPGDDAIVQIAASNRVRITTRENARLKFLQVDGELRMSIHSDTRMLVETLYISNVGLFRVGTVTNTVKPDKTAEIVFISDGLPIDKSWDPGEKSRGFVSEGKVRMYGKRKTNKANLHGSVGRGASTLNLREPVPPDWEVGDEVVLAGTRFRRHEDFQDERLTITAIGDSRLDISLNLLYPHKRVRAGMDIHVANLTRNIVIRSESASIPLRGHIMFLNPDVDVRHVAMIDLGRTNKDIPLDEIIVDPNSGAITPGPANNRRGRYACHFHLNGVSPGHPPPSKVHGSVVIGTPGWGFVNHGSHVDFKENVCYQFVGAAFVTEFGNELGNFWHNIAIRGTGNGEYRPGRVVFANKMRPQPLSDFGFGGDGFWFQGPTLSVRDNVASSCNGAGMIWFTTGAVDIGSGEYVGIDKTVVDVVYANYPDYHRLQARYWYDNPNRLVLSDFPILECSGFHSYACLVGFRLQFNNFHNKPFYGEDPYNYDAHITSPAGGNVRIRQSVTNLFLWNNEQGFNSRYAEQTDWIHVKAFNRIDYHPTQPHLGGEFHHRSKNMTFDSLTIDGYAIAGLLVNDKSDNTSQITFTNRKYANYASADRWLKNSSCVDLSGVSSSAIGIKTATIIWNAHPKAVRYLVRYKRAGAVKWKYETATGLGTTSKTLRNMAPSTKYVFQVIAGCPETVSKWSAKQSFTTLA